MKKVLFATTALVATAGVASADISLSGYAEMGVIGGDTIANTTGVRTVRNSQFHQDIDVTFTMSGETDAGLAFGTAVDLDEDASAVGTAHGGVSVFIRGAFGTLTLGDTDGGFDWGMGEIPAGSSIADNQEGAGYSGNGGLDGIYDGQILTYSYTMGALGVALSFELDDTNTGGAQRDAAMGIGLRYAADLGGSTVNIGVGYQEGERTANVKDEVTGLSIGTTVAGVALGVNYSEQSRQGEARDITHTAVGAAYTMDALTLGVSYGQYENGIMGGNPTFSAGHEATTTALTASYALGGGASMQFGFGSNDVKTGAGVKTSAENWSLGLAMSF